MVVAIYGSPRDGGNTDILMDAFLAPLETEKEIKRFKLREIKLQPCIGCCKCNKTGICTYKDNIWTIYENIEKADGIVLASPIYFASLTAQVKTFIDRGQAFWVRKFLLNQPSPPIKKKGFYLSVGAMDTNKHFLNSRLIVRCFMASLNIEYSGELFVPNIENKGDIEKLPEMLKSSYNLGRDFLKLL